MPQHVAILLRRYIRAILDGIKTVESRLTITRRAPFGCIAPGDVIYFKASSGPYLARAVADGVHFFDHLTPADVEQLQHRYNGQVLGDDAYWQFKANARYATFVRLKDVTPITRGPDLPPSQGIAWFVVPKELELSPAEGCTVLTAGSIRNRYVTLPRDLSGGPDGDVVLHLPDDTVVRTSLHPGSRRLRWRKWGPLLAGHRVEPGDRVLFSEIAAGQYRVAFVRQRRMH